MNKTDVEDNILLLPSYIFPKPREQTSRAFLDTGQNLFASNKAKNTIENLLEDKKDSAKYARACLVDAIFNEDSAKEIETKLENAGGKETLLNLRIRIEEEVCYHILQKEYIFLSIREKDMLISPSFS